MRRNTQWIKDHTLFFLLLVAVGAAVFVLIADTKIPYYVKIGISIPILIVVPLRILHMERRSINMQNRINELETLHAIWQAMDSFPAMETMLDSIVQMIVRLMPTDSVRVYLYDQEQDQLVVKSKYEREPMDGDLLTVAEEVFRSGQAVYSGDVTGDIQLYNALNHPKRYYTLAMIPLNARGRRMGTLCLVDRKKRRVSEDNIRFFDLVSSTISMVLSNHANFNEIKVERDQDGLTGLFNRDYFDRQLVHEINQADRTDGSVYLLMLDVDRFKSVNDEFGHAYGDRVLQKISSVLKHAVRQNDIVARYGGEEFVIILPGACSGTAERVANRIRKQLRASLESSDVFIHLADRVTLSIGSACFPHCSRQAEEIQEMADQRMYVAKRTGGDQYWYTERD